MLYLLLAASSAAWAWPAGNQWLPLERNGTPLTDIVGDSVLPEAYLDLASQGSGPVAWWSADAESLYLRMRLADNPEVDRTADHIDLQPAAWAWLLELDGDETVDYVLAITESEGSLSLYEHKAGVKGVQPFLSPGDRLVKLEPDRTDNVVTRDDAIVRITPAEGSSWYLDLKMARATLDQYGIDATTSFRLLPTTGYTVHSNWGDVGGCEGSCGGLPDVISAPVTIDADLDGLTEPHERARGTDPNDADTDDDGLLDGEEPAGDVDGDGYDNALDCDSDDDGILDGTEAGLVSGDLHPDTDTNAGCFRADADPSTTTDPYRKDTDGGGLHDGKEDWNHNGRLDDWETDPTKASDDLDSDGDGIADVLELRGEDGEVIDVDSDADGIPDAVEGLEDVDGDGIPNFLDLDSDGDGVPDSVEGTEDSSGNGIPDYLDPDTQGNSGIHGRDGNPFVDGHFTGGACSSVPAGALWLPALLAAVFTRRRRVAALALLASPTALAQEVNAQRFTPSVDGGHFLKVEEATPTDTTAGVGVWLGHARDPLVFRRDDGETLSVLGSVTTADLTGFYSFGRVRVGVAAPLHLADLPKWGLVTTESQPLLVRLGDTRLSARATALRLPTADGLDLGAQVELLLPTGGTDAWVGAGRAGVRGSALGTLSAGRLTAAVELGARTGTARELGDLSVSPALLWGAGAHYALTDILGASVELEGERWLGNASSSALPLEWLAAAHLRTGPGHLRIGGGSGLTRGVGAPDFRLLAGFAWELGKLDLPDPMAQEPGKGWLIVRAITPGGEPVAGAEVRVLGTLGTALTTGQDGIFEARLVRGHHEIAVAAPGWTAQNRTVTLDPDETIDLTVVMTPTEEVVVDTEARRIFLQRKVFFELDRADLKVESLRVLDMLVEVLQQNPRIERLRVEGHTDVRGSAKHNLELSQARAEAVVAYLVRSGIEADRLEAKGFGATEPLQHGDTEEVHATNRRVEFHIVELAE